MLTFTDKKIMDKVVKISVSVVNVVEKLRIKKMEKIKNFMKNFSFGSSKTTDQSAENEETRA